MFCIKKGEEPPERIEIHGRGRIITDDLASEEYK